MSTYLLIHGAWHGGWCWQKIVPLLEARGHTVLAPDLPGHAYYQADASTVTLQDYVDRICEIAAARPEPVILAGHSMGGIAITQAAENAPEHFRALVYVCAFLPRDGDSLSTWAAQDHDSLVNPSTIEPRPDGTLGMKKEFIREAFYGECSEADVALAESCLTPQPAAPLGTPVETTPARWGQLPRYYIECARDRAISLKLQRAMQQQSPCRHVFSLDTDHSPFLSTPSALTEILAQIS